MSLRTSPLNGYESIAPSYGVAAFIASPWNEKKKRRLWGFQHCGENVCSVRDKKLGSRSRAEEPFLRL